MTKNLVLQSAERYLKLGLSVIPLKPRSKEPLIKWEPYQTRLATVKELQTWFNSGLSNVGIVTGSLSNLAVLDIDNPQGLLEVSKERIFSPVTVLSGLEGSKHLWFKYSENLRNSASKIAPGIDVRGEGGYVLAPPSVHPNGKRYRFLTSLRLNESAVTRLPIFPMDILFAGAELKENSPLKESKESKEESWISDALEEMKNGHIHNTLVSVLGKFRFHGFSIEDTYKLLSPYAYADGQPYEGLMAKIEEIWGRYESASILSVQPSRYMGERPRVTVHSPANEEDVRNFQQTAVTRNESFRTGFASLDAMLEGGLKSERLFTVAARTGENKTNTTITIAKNLCEQGKRVLYFSTEFSYRKIWERYINQLRDATKFRGHAFYVCDSFSPDLAQVEEALKEIEPDVFVFDHINHVAEEVKPLGEFMQGCNFLMRKHNCQGVIIAQLNRSADWVENGQRIEPRLSMLKGSGTLEQASSRVLLLSEMRITPECDEIRAVLAKNDSGTKGMFMLGLFKNPYRIAEIKA